MIPNLLFLWGWYTPCVAAAASVLMLFAVSRTVWLQCERSAKVFSWEGKRFGVSVLVLLLVFLLLIFRLAQGGIIGLWPAHSDYFWLRQAQFLNIRDAAWPVVLPDGRENELLSCQFPALCGIGPHSPGMGKPMVHFGVEFCGSVHEHPVVQLICLFLLRKAIVAAPAYLHFSRCRARLAFTSYSRIKSPLFP